MRNHRYADTMIKDLNHWREVNELEIETGAAAEHLKPPPDTIIFAGLLNHDEDLAPRRYHYHEDTEPDPELNRVLTAVAAEQQTPFNVKEYRRRRLNSQAQEKADLRWWTEFLREETEARRKLRRLDCTTPCQPDMMALSATVAGKDGGR